jgi:hypothetical protein
MSIIVLAIQSLHSAQSEYKVRHYRNITSKMWVGNLVRQCKINSSVNKKSVAIKYQQEHQGYHSNYS